MGYRILTTLVLTLHFGYLAYVVVGGFVAWRWPRTIWLHLVAAAWGLAVIGIPLRCPLTWVEDWSRRRAGEGAPSAGFVDRYLEGALYPERYTALLQALVALTVVGSYVGFFLLRRGRVTATGRARPRAPR